MTRKICYGLILMTFLILTACGKTSMRPAAQNDILVTQLTPEQSQVVFLRNSFFGSTIAAPIVIAENGDVSLVGIVRNKNKVLHKTTPGEHIYVVGGEGSSLLTASLAGGKTYYVYVEPHMGMFKASFSLEPVTAKGTEESGFRKDLKGCVWYENSPEALEWFKENHSSLKEKYEDSLKRYQNKKPSKQKRIKPEDGLEKPIM